jgi:hypothetical protein
MLKWLVAQGVRALGIQKEWQAGPRENEVLRFLENFGEGTTEDIGFVATDLLPAVAIEASPLWPRRWMSATQGRWQPAWTPIKRVSFRVTPLAACSP